ncbi:hypothetical protein BGZ76_005654 [Entomortierella beljakovae]|nr:hypothetical protein BGZ76_005654 [Entomortierella beljakovae]
MASEDTNSANYRAREFKEPESTLDLNANRNVVLGNESIKGTETRIRARLLMDSDDDMDGDDDDDDDELLMMPGSSQKMGLQIDLSYSAPLSSKNDDIILPSQEIEHPSPQSKVANLQESGESNGLVHEEEGLFGEDFMAQFGDDGEIDSEAFLNKKPLFPRKVTLLRATIDNGDSSGNNDDLGLDRLSISQKHWTKSGVQAVSESTKSVHTATSSTTIISAVPHRFNMFNRQSMGSIPPMSQDEESSQLEEELLEMTARQHDASLEDLILEDELLGDEDEDLGDILQMQYHAQEIQELEQHGANETNKRKLPVSHTNHSVVVPTPVHNLEDFPGQRSSVVNSSAARIHDKTKKTRLEYASTGSTNSRDTNKTLSSFSIKSRLPDVPKYDYTLPPETGSFIKARSFTGQTFYLKKRVHVDKRKNAFLQQLKENSADMKPLLSMPIHRMMDELDAEIRIQKQEAINLIELGESDELDIETGSSNSQSERLWVDKYKPRKYTDLMGDERVNRGVLSWIKEWDQCVFGRKYKKYVPEYKQQQQQQFKEFRKQDPLGRPDRKILLITGPPGLGKTTMAHVIAKQAGYNVIEVNASDDRTGQSVKGKIESVLDNQSIIGNNKPSLLIIDEIDGVSSSGGEHSFIKLLVDIATVEAATKEDKAKAAGKKSKKGTKKPLMRPIICICNDQYAPALRPLRVIAQIYQFKKPSIRGIVTRLQQICEIEKIPSDTRAFGALYEMTEGDMRSCLNTLQFIKGKIRASGLSALDSAPTRIGGGGNTQGHGLTLEALSKASVGHKDLNKSLFSVWEELFQAPYARKSRGTLKVMEDGRDNLVKGKFNAR